MNKYFFVLMLGALLFLVSYACGQSREAAEKACGMNFLSGALCGDVLVPDVESDVTSGMYHIIDRF